MKYFIVRNKADDYGNCTEELVQTTVKNSKEYYSVTDVLESEVSVLKKYMTFVAYDEEKHRTEEHRYYGNE